MKKLLLALLATQLIISALIAQSPLPEYEKLLQPAALKADLALLKYNLETVHGGLYLYSSKEIIDAEFAKIESELTEPMTSFQFHQKLCRFNKIIGNGHTAFMVSKSYHDATQKELPRMPYEFYRDNNEVFVTRNMSDDFTVQPGWKIKSINGTDANTLFQTFVDMQGRDGRNTTFPEAYVNSRFSLCYAFYYGCPEKYDMIFEDETGKEHALIVQGITLDKIKANRDKRYKKNKKVWYEEGLSGLSLEIKENKTAILTIRTFSRDLIRQTGKRSKKFFQSAFEQIEQAGIEHLIIDMRDNGGGDPSVSVHLFEHISQKPFTFYEAAYAKTRKIPNPKLYDGAKFINLIGWAVLKKNKEGTYNLMTKGMKSQKLKSPVYRNKMYVLTNGGSFSQTGETAGYFKSETDAIFIGEECGGSPIQNTSGVGLPLELPNSKNIVVIPLIVWKMNVNYENTGRGVIPDHIVKPTIEDVLEDKDVVMDYTLNLIESK